MKTIPRDQIHTFRTIRAYFMSGGNAQTPYIARWLEKYGLTEEDVRSTIKPLKTENRASQGARASQGVFEDTLERLKKVGLVD